MKKSRLRFRLARLLLSAEKFVQEQLWQHVLVSACVLFIAWMLFKPIQAAVFCIAHIVIRLKFSRQYHARTTASCLAITVSAVIGGILYSFPIGISLLSSIAVAFGVCWVGDLFQHKIELQHPSFDIDQCTREELIERCIRFRFSAQNTELAILFFVDKVPHKVIAEKLCIEEKSVTVRKKRMREKLNKK